jgi:hypothetical protein
LIDAMESQMNRRLLTTLVGGTAVLAAIGVWIATAAPTRGPVFIAGDQPVTEEQVRQKLEADGYLNVLIVRQGRSFEAMGTKDGKVAKFVVDAQNGRLASDDDDDD